MKNVQNKSEKLLNLRKRSYYGEVTFHRRFQTRFRGSDRLARSLGCRCCEAAGRRPVLALRVLEEVFWSHGCCLAQS